MKVFCVDSWSMRQKKTWAAMKLKMRKLHGCQQSDKFGGTCWAWLNQFHWFFCQNKYLFVFMNCFLFAKYFSMLHFLTLLRLFFPYFFFFKDMETNTEFFIIVLQGRFWLRSMWRITYRYQWRKAKTPASMSQSRWHNNLSTPSITLPTWWTTGHVRLCLYLFISYFHSVFNHSAIQFNDANSICRYLARVAPSLGLYGTNSMEQTEVCFSDWGHNLEKFVANKCHVVLGRPLAGVQRSSPVRSIWLDRSPGWPGQGPFPADLSSWTCCHLGRPVCLGRTQRFSSFAVVSVEFRGPAELQCVLYLSAGRSEWPDQGKSFSNVNRWFFFLNSQVPFSAVGSKYARKTIPISKSNVSLFTEMQKLLKWRWLTVI